MAFLRRSLVGGDGSERLEAAQITAVGASEHATVS
jgi:hypothetical protein